MRISFFFLKLYRLGFEIRWNSKAKVIEERKKKRENLLWFIRRNFRYGASSKIIYIEAYGYFLGTILLITKLSLDLYRAIFYLIISIYFSKKNLIRSIMFLSRALGAIFGFFGVQFKEYA